MSSALCQQLTKSTQEYLLRAKPLLLGAARLTPEVSVLCDLRGKSAGQLRRYNDGRLVIRYNLAIASLQPETFLQETVPHEVAHAITWLCYGNKAKAHGQEWQSVMQFFGIEQAARCHSFELPNQSSHRQRRWQYQCECQQHLLSTTRHNRIMKGQQRYFCKRCKSELIAQIS